MMKRISTFLIFILILFLLNMEISSVFKVANATLGKISLDDKMPPLTSSSSNYMEELIKDLKRNYNNDFKHNIKIRLYSNIDSIIRVPQNYSTIQEAIDAANPGDIIIVASGIYHENLIINKSVSLIGEGRETTKIIGSGVGDVIYISSDNVTISGFTIENSGAGRDDAGIELDKVMDCHILKCNVTNNRYGILLDSSNYNIIEKNICYFNQKGLQWYPQEELTMGILLHNSSNNKIISNICEKNAWGIGLWGPCNNNTIRDNICNWNLDHGIKLLGEFEYDKHDIKNVIPCRNNKIINNTCSNNNHAGIWIFVAENTIIVNNTCILNKEPGIFLRGLCTNSIIINNTCIKNEAGIGIHSSNNNTVKNNFCLHNYYGIRLIVIPTVHGRTIESMKSCSYNVIDNNTCAYNTLAGIAVNNLSNNNIIINNMCHSNHYFGIILGFNTGNKIYNNICINNHQLGIFSLSSNHNMFINNTINLNGWGLFINSSDYNRVINNTIQLNGEAGIVCVDASYNTFVNNILVNNSIKNIHGQGIWLDNSSSNVILLNMISKNGHGILLSKNSIKNKIYWNNIEENHDCGICSDATNEVNATYNWWGDPSGPYHPTLNPNGKGDRVGNNVIFKPWLKLPANIIVIDKAYVSDDRCDVGTYQNVYFHAVWSHNSSNIANGVIYVNETGYITNETGWIKISVKYNTIGKRTWIVTGVNCNGIRKYMVITDNPYIIWDRVKITLYTPNDRVNVGSNVTILWRGVYEYDGSVFNGSITLNNTQYRYDTVGCRGYKVISIYDPVYGLTAFTSNELKVIWDKIYIELLTSDNRIDVGTDPSLYFKATYLYDGSDATPYIEVTYNYSKPLMEAGSLWIGVEKVSDRLYGITAFDCKSIKIIWDQVIINLKVIDNRIPVGEKAEIICSSYYAYDGSPANVKIILNTTLTSNVVCIKHITVSKIIDMKHGLRSFKSNVISVIWDLIIVRFPASNIDMYEFENITINWTAYYAYDNSPLNATVIFNATPSRIIEPGEYMIKPIKAIIHDDRYNISKLIFIPSEIRVGIWDIKFQISGQVYDLNRTSKLPFTAPTRTLFSLKPFTHEIKFIFGEDIRPEDLRIIINNEQVRPMKHIETYRIEDIISNLSPLGIIKYRLDIKGVEVIRGEAYSLNIPVMVIYAVIIILSVIIFRSKYKSKNSS